MACRLGPKGGGPKNQLEMVQLAILEKQTQTFSQEGRKVGRQESSAEDLPAFLGSCIPQKIQGIAGLPARLELTRAAGLAVVPDGGRRR
ncbi:MAG: hypothetical protein FJ125_14835 [Deltaproteobacteria bacterium]|nr:hypothetical protein [Deltaproteobacteria bacterium]